MASPKLQQFTQYVEQTEAELPWRQLLGAQNHWFPQLSHHGGLRDPSKKCSCKFPDIVPSPIFTNEINRGPERLDSLFRLTQLLGGCLHFHGVL